MSRIRQSDSLDAFEAPKDQPIHLAIGMFDGLHVGHRSVIESAVAQARLSGGCCGALTFWPHPSRLFRPDDPARMILNPEIKRRELEKHSIDFVIQEPFTQAFAAIPADAFARYLKERIPSLATLHTGQNWRFGQQRKGDVSLLAELAEAVGVEAFSVESEVMQGDRVSSTRIRSHLKLGEIEQANALLGYDYYSLGTVTQGKRMGRSMGTPTLNLPFEGDLKPAYGVYAVTVSDASLNHRYRAVANFGIRPTVEVATRPVLEAFLLEDCPFDYGQRLKVDWLHFIRQERKFDGVDELKAAIASDVAAAKTYFDI